METINKLNKKLIWMLISLTLVFVLISNAYAYRSVISRENAVTVDVRPEQLANGKPVKFVVRLNTHSVDLSYDLVADSVLKDDNGKTYEPLGWEGSPSGGHHRNGTLEFPELEGSPKTVTLVIRNISNVPERIFKWDIE